MNQDEIRIGDLLSTLLKRWKLLVGLTVLGFAIGFVLNSISFVRGNYTSYEIYCSVAVTSEDATTGGHDFNLAEDMTEATAYLMTSYRVLSAAIDEAEVISVTPQDVASNLSIRRYNDTQILEMTLWWTNADAGVELMNSILNVTRRMMPLTLMQGSLMEIDAPAAYFTPGGGGYVSIRWWITGLIGLVLGLGIVGIEFLVRPTLMDPKSVEDTLGLEMLGIIPRDVPYFQSTKELLSSEPTGNSSIEQNFAAAAYILCNRLSGKNKNHCFYITSAEDGEGKSTVAANLAVQISNLERHVLLVDLNLRNPSLGGMFLQTVDYNRTLNALYKGEATVQDAVVSLTGYLDLLPAVLERNAVNLDGALFEFLKQMIPHYEYIIVDTPSIGQSSDVLRLNEIAEAALMVIRYDTVPMPAIQEAIDKLDKSGIRILGCIVNASKQMRGFRSWQSPPPPPPADTAMEADEQRPAIPQQSDAGWSTPGQAPEEPRSVLDELIGDQDGKDKVLSDDEAIDALLQMGAEGSWKQPQEDAPAQDEPEPADRPQEQSEAAPVQEPEVKEEQQVYQTVGAAPEPEQAPPAAPQPDPEPDEEARRAERKNALLEKLNGTKKTGRKAGGKSKPKHG